MLARIRRCQQTPGDIERLHSRTVRQLAFRGEWDSFQDGMVTYIYPTNADVQRENTMARMRLTPPDHDFVTEFVITTNLDQAWRETDASFYATWVGNPGPIPSKWFVKCKQS